MADPLTQARVGSVDVYPLRRVGSDWQVLVLRRAAGTRCTGAWEVVHGHIEDRERPEGAALRELREETGLAAQRLYTTGSQPFYLSSMSTLMLAVAFAAVVDGSSRVTLGPEHDRAEWLPSGDALARLSWPRSRAMLGDILSLLRDGDAGVLEDVLRVPPEARG